MSLGNPAKLTARRAGDPLDLLGRVMGHLGADLIHAPDTLADELLVLPAILEDVPENAPNKGHIGAWTETHIFIGMGRRAREARVTDDQWRIVLLLGLEKMEQRHRMRLGGIAADDKDRLGLVDVVVGVGHRTIAPGVGNTCNRGGVTDTGLMIDIVRAPEGRELTHQIGLLVIVLGRAEPINRIRAALLANGKHLIADLGNRGLPVDFLPFAAGEPHGIFQPPLAMRVLAHRRTLGAMGAKIKRAVETRLLPDPHTVLNLGNDRATH